MIKILQKPTKTIIPYARNPRDNQAAVSKVAGSINEFGWQQPIVVDAEMVVIAGHTRLLAAQQLGLDKVPVVVADKLTAAQVKAYRLADNRTGQEATWNSELLGLELQDLAGLDFNLDLLGFDDAELKGLSNYLNPEFEPGNEEDQGKLDQLAPKIVTCPHCEKQFDLREHE